MAENVVSHATYGLSKIYFKLDLYLYASTGTWVGFLARHLASVVTPNSGLSCIYAVLAQKERHRQHGSGCGVLRFQRFGASYGTNGVTVAQESFHGVLRHLTKYCYSMQRKGGVGALRQSWDVGAKVLDVDGCLASGLRDGLCWHVDLLFFTQEEPMVVLPQKTSSVG